MPSSSSTVPAHLQAAQQSIPFDEDAVSNCSSAKSDELHYAYTNTEIQNMAIDPQKKSRMKPRATQAKHMVKVMMRRGEYHAEIVKNQALVKIKDLNDKLDDERKRVKEKESEFPKYSVKDNSKPTPLEWGNYLRAVSLWSATSGVSEKNNMSKAIMHIRTGDYRSDRTIKKFVEDCTTHSSLQAARTRLAAELWKRLPAGLQIYVPDKSSTLDNGLRILTELDSVLGRESAEKTTLMVKRFMNPPPCTKQSDLLKRMKEEELKRHELIKISNGPEDPTRRLNLLELCRNLPLRDVITVSELTHPQSFTDLYRAIERKAEEWQALAGVETKKANSASASKPCGYLKRGQ